MSSVKGRYLLRLIIRVYDEVGINVCIEVSIYYFRSILTIVDAKNA